MLDFFAVADLCVDVILRGNTRPRFSQVEQIIGDYTIELGGSATICAGQFANLGGTAGVMGLVGEDLFGELVWRRLAEVGIDRQHVRKEPRIKTGAGFALVEDEDRAILTYLGSIDAVNPADLTEELLGVAKHWHVASYFLLGRLRGVWPDWLKKLRKRGVTVSLDSNWAPGEDWGQVRELLPLVDWFFPNENEARAITGETDIDKAGKTLATFGCGVVIKRGSKGAFAWRGGQEWQGCIAQEAVVDSVGAGDCFDAGFLRAWQLGWKIEKCMEMGMRCGASSVQAAGGFAGQLREVLRAP